MRLANVIVVGKEEPDDILIRNDMIRSVIPSATTNQTRKNEATIFFGEAILFPGLINSHDHLDFNLFPALRNRIYNSYTEWGKDIQETYKEEIQ